MPPPDRPAGIGATRHSVEHPGSEARRSVLPGPSQTTQTEIRPRPRVDRWIEDKAGLLIAPASILAGRVRLVDIGLTPDLDKLEPLLIVPDPIG